MRAFEVAVVGLAALSSVFVAAQASYGYYGWEYNGCPSLPLTDAEYNSVDSLALAQWWTITFTDNVNPIGGMINFVRLAAGGVGAVQISITNGINGANQLLLQTQTHPLGFSSTGPDSFCIGTQGSNSVGCLDQNSSATSVRGYGAGTAADGTAFKYDLTLTRQLDDTWCMMQDASAAINISSLESVTWYHYAPAATVSGYIVIGGQTYALTGVGQQDHVYGAFIPTVTLFKHWMDAHFYNAESGFVMYWGAMGDSWSFARMELPSAAFMFNNITHAESYDPAFPTRPVEYDVRGSNDNGDTFAVQYKVIVSGLNYGSNPIEDIVTLSGAVCPVGGDCIAVSGRGWAQVIGGPTSSSTPLFTEESIAKLMHNHTA